MKVGDYMEKSFWKYFFSLNAFNVFAGTAGLFSFLFTDLIPQNKLIILLICLALIAIYSAYCYFKDLLKYIATLQSKNNALSESLSVAEAEIDAITQNRNYLEKLLKDRDNSISFYEKLLNDIDMFHLFFLATPGECERNNILQLKDYISNQVRNFKENDFNE